MYHQLGELGWHGYYSGKGFKMNTKIIFYYFRNNHLFFLQFTCLKGCIFQKVNLVKSCLTFDGWIRSKNNQVNTLLTNLRHSSRTKNVLKTFPGRLVFIGKPVFVYFFEVKLVTKKVLILGLNTFTLGN